MRLFNIVMSEQIKGLSLLYLFWFVVQRRVVALIHRGNSKPSTYSLHAETECLDILHYEVLLQPARQRLVVEGCAFLRASVIQIGVEPDAIVAATSTHRERLFGGVDEELIITRPCVAPQFA